MNKTTIKIAYLDDDTAAQYTFYSRIEKAIIDINNDQSETPFNLECEFELVNDLVEDSDSPAEDFLNQISSKGYLGLILDYSLASSGIFNDAGQIWRKIKMSNPLFPIAIITSHDSSDLELNQGPEKFFEKGEEPSDFNPMIEYLTEQINLNIQIKETYERANLGLKKESQISYNSLINESEQEGLFSMEKEKFEEKFSSLINEALEIIKKYS